MRTLVRLVAFVLIVAGGTALLAAERPSAIKRPLFNVAAYRPLVALHPLPPVTGSAFLTVSGVIFSRSPLEKVTVGDRTALLRDAEPDDLVKLPRAPVGASEAPYRTYFEVPDAALPRLGANDLEVRAAGADGRLSDAHRITIVRSLTAPAEAKP